MPTIPLPSGLVGEVHKIRGIDMAEIAEEAESGSSSGGFDRIIGRCWVSVVDPGPYSFVRAGDTAVDWKRVLKGDMLATLVHLRRISMRDGDDFEFDVKCEECGKRIAWTVPLSKVPVHTLPAASRERVAKGELFDVDIMRDGVATPARFALATLGQEDGVHRLMKAMKRSTLTPVDALAAQIVSISGVANDPKSRWRFLAELSWGELDELRAKIDAHDCGYDTAIEIVCPERDCRWEQTVNLPFLNRRFFLPKRKRQTAPDPEEQADSGETSSAVFHSSGGATSATTSGGTSTGGQATGA